MGLGLSAQDLVPGRLYRIVMSDCCVSAVMYATFVQIVYDDEGIVDSIMFDTIRFDRAYESAVFFEEAKGKKEL